MDGVLLRTNLMCACVRGGGVIVYMGVCMFIGFQVAQVDIRDLSLLFSNLCIRAGLWRNLACCLVQPG